MASTQSSCVLKKNDEKDTEILTLQKLCFELSECIDRLMESASFLSKRRLILEEKARTRYNDVILRKKLSATRRNQALLHGKIRQLNGEYAAALELLKTYESKVDCEESATGYEELCDDSEYVPTVECVVSSDPEKSVEPDFESSNESSNVVTIDQSPMEASFREGEKHVVDVGSFIPFDGKEKDVDAYSVESLNDCDMERAFWELHVRGETFTSFWKDRPLTSPVTDRSRTLIPEYMKCPGIS